jgi:hypothetical protein
VRAQCVGVKERELAEVIDQLVVGLRERGVVDRPALTRGNPEAHLLRQDRLAGAGASGQDHEAPCGQAAPEHEIQFLDAGLDGAHFNRLFPRVC